MKINIYKVSKDRIVGVSYNDISEITKDYSSSYIVDVQASDRVDASNELKKLGLELEICTNLLEPSEHIKFEYIGNSVYGELAYFSPTIRESNYLGIIIRKNMLVGIHPVNEGILPNLLKTKNLFAEQQKDSITPEFLLCIFVLEVLSQYGKLILSYREGIELLAVELDKEDSDVSPRNFLESKSQLSDFSRALGKLFFTLSFPPTKDVLEIDNPYNSIFEHLMKSINLIKISLQQTEERLNSLNDHYQLLLQAKANKRLNFLTIIQAIFVPLTLLAGIYGMNFQYIPELNYKYGYFVTLGAMVLIVLGFLRYFKKHGWFE